MRPRLVTISGGGVPPKSLAVPDGDGITDEGFDNARPTALNFLTVDPAFRCKFEPDGGLANADGLRPVSAAASLPNATLPRFVDWSA
mmetsp:Transcript_33674/g.39184  ORF Transcript_33674/g.39184 Transcript_33674/m.39184 type:complete len:87 (+) Transcript_33674:191-451(+)